MINVDSLAKSCTSGKRANRTSLKAVKNVSFKAENGSITGLLGPNGAGKSTTLRILATLMKADSGAGIIDGFELHEQALEIRKNIGFLPHNSGLYPRLTAWENIHYYGELCGLSGRELNHRVEELIELLDMREFALRKTEGFSQGQQTRVALARTLVNKPRTLLLDEPTNGLDVMATRSLRDILRTLAKTGYCILLSSHIMQEVEILCDHIAIISAGRIAAEGSLSDILNATESASLEDAFVSLVSSDPNLSGEAS